MRSQMRKLESSQRNLEVEVVVDNDNYNKLNSEPNDDAFLFENVSVEEGSPRVAEDRVDSPNVVENCTNDVPSVGNDQVFENEQILADDFSPETTEKLEDFMKKFDEASYQKKTDLVTEVEAELQKGGTNGEADVILVAEGGKNGCVSVEKVVEVADNVEKVSEAVEKSRKEVASNPEVVEPVFSSLELFGPEFEKPNFKIDEVIAADFDLAVPENAEAFVLQVQNI